MCRKIKEKQTERFLIPYYLWVKIFDHGVRRDKKNSYSKKKWEVVSSFMYKRKNFSYLKWICARKSVIHNWKLNYIISAEGNLIGRPPRLSSLKNIRSEFVKSSSLLQ